MQVRLQINILLLSCLHGQCTVKHWYKFFCVMLVKLLVRIRSVNKTSILGCLQYWTLLHVLCNSNMLVLSYSFRRYWEMGTLPFWPKGWVLVFSGCILFLCSFGIVSLFFPCILSGKSRSLCSFPHLHFSLNLHPSLFLYMFLLFEWAELHSSMKVCSCLV